VIVLDTHVLVWWTILPASLSRRATTALTEAERLLVPTIVFWETALLVRKGRLALDLSVEEWAEQVLAIPRVEAVPLSVAMAVRADGLSMHADPVDRFVVATALETRAQLVTLDRAIRRSRLVRTIW
jgi:PIN domain nuclease of toxin-antitoxin system